MGIIRKSIINLIDINQLAIDEKSEMTSEIDDYNQQTVDSIIDKMKIQYEKSKKMNGWLLLELIKFKNCGKTDTISLTE